MSLLSDLYAKEINSFVSAYLKPLLLRANSRYRPGYCRKIMRYSRKVYLLVSNQQNQVFLMLAVLRRSL